MKKIVLSLLLLVSSVLKAQEEEEVSFTLFSKIAENNMENVVISPYSIRECMSMVYIASKGKTRRELAQVLAFPNCNDDFFKVHKKLQGIDSVCAVIHKPVPLNPYFKKVLSDHYKANFFGVDTSKNMEEEINRWVQEKTHNKITHLMNNVNPNVALLLANAVYFKKDWKNGFHKNSTRDAIFHTIFEDVSVSMMQALRCGNYFESNEVQSFILPFEKDDTEEQYAMLILLPKEGKFETVKKKLNRQFVAECIKNREYKNVLLYVPKVDFKFKKSCKDMLVKMGIERAYLPSAELRMFMGQSPCWIDDVMHGATFSMNESGVEATAATVATVVMGIHWEPDDVVDEELNCNRPFFIVLYEQKSGKNIFIAQVTNPKA